MRPGERPRFRFCLSAHGFLLGEATPPTAAGQKLDDGRTQLYPLTRFDTRKQEAVGKRYLDGWYGAKPILAPGDFDSVADLVISENS